MRSGRNRGDYSRRREDIARGKRPVVSDDDFVEELTMQDAPFPETLRDDEPDDTLTEIEMLRLRSLLDMRFGGTRYADSDTMQTLRIAEDVDEMFTNVGIGRLMYQKHKSYRKATCLLLAAFTDHPCDAGKSTPDGSDGYISFWATGRRHYLSYREIDRSLSLPPGNSHGLDVDRDKMTALWGTIAFGDYFSSTTKSSHIRSPPIRYIQKAIANTLFSRHATGNVTETEMAMIDVALTGIRLRLINGTQLTGSRSHGGITLALVSQLRSYQDWASRNRGIRHKCTLRMGGLVTPLLRVVGFTADWEEEVAPPEGLDIEYLRNSVFLQKTSDDRQLLYQFVHVQLGASRMLLPSPSWTTIRGGSNVEFNPPQSALYTGDRPSVRDYATPPATTHRGDWSHAELDTTQTDELDHLHFAGYTTTARQSAGLKAAHQHISILLRWNKAQDKITSKLKSKVKKMADQIRAMHDELSCVASASGGVQRTAVGPRQADLSEDDEPHHDTTGGRPLPPDPPRHSSFEPRQQRKRRHGEQQTARPSGARADADLPFRRCRSVSRQTAPTDHHTPPTRAPPDQYVPYSTEGAAPTTIPP
ncbi:unnamed protein product [Microthlaspi erraticum]|uniref:Arabidopsis retrotransposon Orf1 C-terminal domain-containing protein n=1 Tax=Microthlaspi erraticum TaxID=1685480 RepID=A0A6D2JBH2_9BRAS|nr:unnamed protein product [Microthlaspi erraticum]